MAGEINDPYSITYQSDSVHSGSISFGRFDNEVLSWERRCSFTHNKYLEEVEKYSKPGSVTEKKAYFEAHFKKKALLRKSTAESQNGIDYQTSESNVPDNVGYTGQTEHADTNYPYDQFEKTRIQYQSSENGVWDTLEYTKVMENANADYHCDEKCGIEYQTSENGVRDNVGNAGESEHANTDYHYGHFEKIWAENQTSENGVHDNMHSTKETEHATCNHYDHIEEIPEVLQYGGDREVIIHGKDYPTALSFESQKEPVLHNAENLVDTVLEDFHLEEEHLTHTGRVKLLPPKNVAELDAIDNFGHNSGSACESSKAINTSAKSRKSGETITQIRRDPYPKLMIGMDVKSAKPRLKSQVKVSQAQKKVPSHAEKVVAKNPSESSRRMKGVNLLPENVSSSTSSIRRSPKSEVILSLNHENRRDRKLGGRKVVESQSVTLKDVDNGSSQTPNRVKETVSSSKADTRPSAAFNFKSNERAEKRKEFNTKLEEKIHAKEAEINQLEARTQEKTEADIKQLRKNLNFKATPMPSFYHAVPSESEANKAMLSKLRYKSRSPGTGSPLHSKAGSHQAFFTNGSRKSTPEASAASNCPTAEPVKSSKLSQPESTSKNSSIEAKELEHSETHSYKHRLVETCKPTVSHRVEGKHKLVGRRSSKEMMRKEMKDIATGSRSHITVGVAS